jgi:hypothetical protein
MAKIVELIYTQEVRGKGVEDNPYRAVDQWFEKDGVLVFENDPCNPKKSIERRLRNQINDLNDIILWLNGERGEFPIKTKKDGPYHWRNEMMKRFGGLRTV